MKNLNELFSHVTSIIDYRLGSNNDPDIESQVLSVILSMGKDKRQISSSVMGDMKEAIQWSVRRSLPINISLMWAVCGHARSAFKILDWEINLPRLSDIWGIYWFYLLNQKVQKIYPPGVNVVIVDEVPQVSLTGWNDDEIRIRQDVMKGLIPPESGITIIDLPNFNLNGHLPEATPEQVLMILTSTDLIEDIELQAQLGADLYKTQDKDWSAIMSSAGEKKWKDAEHLARKMNAIGVARKEMNWVAREVFRGQPYIDACITRKDRWCPDIWRKTFPFHGGTVVQNGEEGTSNYGRFSVLVVPESRMKSFVPTKFPVSVFQEYTTKKIPWSGEMTMYWCYQKKEEKD